MFASQERIWADYEKTVIPLKSLSSVPALKARPVIIARVVSKSERRISVNDEPYFVIFLSDGTLVKAQFYNEVAVNFYKLIQKGKLYEISNFTVRNTIIWYSLFLNQIPSLIPLIMIMEQLLPI